MLFYMVGVQQLLCFLTQRFFQEFLIKLLYIRIVVGLVQRTVAVDGIELIAQYIGTPPTQPPGQAITSTKS